MNSAQVRKKFLEFFAQRGHQVVASSPVIPAQDPTLLFTNAGMNQFKDLFLGNQARSYKRAVTAQKCVRAGGKHNDLDQVGFTHRHLTFFEMLGNFSFGDYFKSQAIRFAWDFLTQELQMDPELLSVTVHHSDTETAAIWRNEIGFPVQRIISKGDEDNFWQMGDTGPCGPCSEIFYDRGAEFDYQGQDERFIEIWNMVFMQYNRQLNGNLEPLAQCGVDTGMGFERLITVLSGAQNIFHTEVFAPLQQQISLVTGLKYFQCDDKTKAAFNVLCDHVRSSSFIIADGAKPSNDGRGYVLRKIIRRALLFAKKLSNDRNLFASLVAPLVMQMGVFYPELQQMQQTIEFLLLEETERFFSSLEKGERIFISFASLAAQEGQKVLSGEKAFKLYDTYGFPLEITRIMAMEAGLEVDLVDFERCMLQQKEQSGKLKKMQLQLELPADLQGEFVGYEQTKVRSAINWLGRADANGQLWFSTERNPFFAARGGQVSDTGFVLAGNVQLPVLEVKELPTSPATKTVLLRVQGQAANLQLGQAVELAVDMQTRLDTSKNHTATHLLHAALRQVLGAHATQAGSVVEPDFLRFDFNHNKALTAQQLHAVEQLVNLWIGRVVNSDIFHTSMQVALDRGADAIFGEKYNPELVRVVDYPGISIELCGGTHLRNTGQVGMFKIVSEESIGIGVRRIVALTGRKALELFQSSYALLKDLSQQFACKQEQVAESLRKQWQKQQQQEKELGALRSTLALSQAQSLLADFTLLPTPMLLSEITVQLSTQLKQMAQWLVEKRPAGLVFLYCKQADDKIMFVCAIGKDLRTRIDIAQLVPTLAKCGLRAGGKDVLLQGGGNAQNIAAVQLALAQVLNH